MKDYTIEDYERPSVTSDIVLFRYTDALEIFLIERTDEPFKGMLSLPGGFVLPTESTEDTAVRVLKEKTGIHPEYIEQLCFMSKLGRDPRGWVDSAVYMGFVTDQSEDSRWHNVNTLGQGLASGRTKLAFDHAELFATAVARLRNKIDYTTVAFHMLPKRFAMTDLYRMYDEIKNGEPLSQSNFKTNMMRKCILNNTGTKGKDKRNRTVEMYELREDAVMDHNTASPVLSELFK